MVNVKCSMIDGVIGQEQAITLLNQGIKNQKIAPAYLFVGTPGIGKSLTAQKFARSLLNEESSNLESHPDLMWVEPTYSDKGNLIKASEAKAQGIVKKNAPKLRIEQVRQISQFLTRNPLKSDRLIVVIEDADLMAEAPANALLKTLEEPGRGTIILIAPSIDSLLTTIVSRCQVIRFTPLSRQNLQLVLEKANYPEIVDNTSLMAMAQGSPGLAISAWEQLQLIPEDLWQKILTPPENTLVALMTAKTITQELDLTSQLWLVDYLQSYYWQQNQSSSCVHKWEEARQYLMSYVQPRLVWECLLSSSTLLNFSLKS